MNEKQIANVTIEVDEEFVKTLKKLVIRPKPQRIVAM